MQLFGLFASSRCTRWAMARPPEKASQQPREACAIVPGKLGSKLGEYAGAAVALYALHEIGEWDLPWQNN